MSNEKKSSSINWYPGHMVKAKRQMQEDLKLIDVVVEILDARIPISSQNPDLKSMIGNKKKIVVLNKADLADQKENEKWVQYFKQKQIPAVLTQSNTGNGIANVIKEIEKVMQPEMDLLAQKGRIGKSIRVMVAGIPNVGKSSFINRIAKKNTLEVGNKRGVTRKNQWMRINNKIELLDTPGVLWPKFETQEVALHLSYIGTIKDDILDRTEIAFFLLKYLLENYLEKVEKRYKIEKQEIEQILSQTEDPNSNILSIMHTIGRKRGAILSGGRIDEEKTAKLIIDDFRTGKLGNISIEKVKEN